MFNSSYLDNGFKDFHINSHLSTLAECYHLMLWSSII